MQLPPAFISKYQALLGAEAIPFLDSFQAPAVHGFRINPLKPPANLTIDLSHPIPTVPNGYYGKVAGKTPEHQSGYVYSQEPSAMQVAQVVNPQAGERVLDLCAAPGGKSTQLAGMLNNSGLLVANEIDRSRAKVLVENLERAGVWNPLILNEDPDSLARHFPRYFDKILVDAPCSGEGMFRKNPQAMKYWSLDYPAACAVRQRTILPAALKMLKPGGELVYSTCTFAPEEDEQIIAWLLKEFPLKVVPITKTAGMEDGRPAWANQNPALADTVRLFPQNLPGDGHFIAKLRYEPTDAAGSLIKTQRSNVAGELRKWWQQLVSTEFTVDPATNLLSFGKTLYSYHPDIPDLQQLKVMRPGTPVANIKKQRLEPAYGLALALKPQSVQKRLTLTRAEWQIYVHGDTLSVDPKLPKGWYLLDCQGMPIGFGKVVQGTLKNFFPKGLRFQI
ncbi:tRNA and rRNA cytosine-C5-methylase [Fructilactobacillus florum 8D]|uniref:tRNA and rRNA cytosine-C5-methylase n=1 Tax=Fructilactobacillus florum 8D TaxID=1221538 RepID=W9EH96_9LACO|nr:RsmB/NOP family class I SAM-dependent RNA methyltransferase [Fructilactobacillus florum]EKK20955.1 tRNA and rRNA cytosine-C5-methylase [Fructilactobacillus florum 2F]ETO40636.1 tRNA and rRNA cytosine-C5-methylase [Fructilactobacillus florum 8D]